MGDEMVYDFVLMFEQGFAGGASEELAQSCVTKSALAAERDVADALRFGPS